MFKLPSFFKTLYFFDNIKLINSLVVVLPQLPVIAIRGIFLFLIRLAKARLPKALIVEVTLIIGIFVSIFIFFSHIIALAPALIASLM